MNELIDAALLEADRCVKCGLCLPGCPTYQLYSNENESPRGRIALAEALLKGEIAPDRTLKRHLGNCLLCRQCEVNCPSKVDYTRLMDAARQQLHTTQWTSRLLEQVDWLPALGKLSRLLPGTAGALGRSLDNTKSTPPAGGYPPVGQSLGHIGLLLGCVTRFNQGGALQAAIQLLTRLGFHVSVPAEQTCCGALARHSGHRERADRLQAINSRAFAGLDAVVSIASGCSQHLHSYPEPIVGVDIVEFLDRVDDWSQLAFSPPTARWVLHQPCTLRNGLHAEKAVARLLDRLSAVPPLSRLGESGGCCGAAGDHLLRNRQQATALRQPYVDRLVELAPDVLITSNVGCAMHLAEGVRAELPNLKVLHPVEWMVQHLQPLPAGPAKLAANTQEQA
jgi:glycolate oxidase iron-sulfur subunit